MLVMSTAVIATLPWNAPQTRLATPRGQYDCCIRIVSLEASGGPNSSPVLDRTLGLARVSADHLYGVTKT